MLNLHISQDVIWVGQIVPPMMIDPVLLTYGPRNVSEPPLVVFPHIPIAPLFAVHLSDNAFEIGKVVPIVAVAEHISGVAPIIVLFAVGREMDIATIGLSRSDFVVKGEQIPIILVLWDIAKQVAEHRFSGMTDRKSVV